MLIGTGLVMAALIGLALLAGTHFGHTQRMNQDLTAPHISALNPPEWMSSAPHAPR